MRAADLEDAHVGDVEEAGGLAHGVVLVEHAGVPDRHLPAGEGDHLAWCGPCASRRAACASAARSRAPANGRRAARGGRAPGRGCDGRRSRACAAQSAPGGRPGRDARPARASHAGAVVGQAGGGTPRQEHPGVARRSTGRDQPVVDGLHLVSRRDQGKWPAPPDSRYPGSSPRAPEPPPNVGRPARVSPCTLGPAPGAGPRR